MSIKWINTKMNIKGWIPNEYKMNETEWMIIKWKVNLVEGLPW